MTVTFYSQEKTMTHPISGGWVIDLEPRDASTRSRSSSAFRIMGRSGIASPRWIPWKRMAIEPSCDFLRVQARESQFNQGRPFSLLLNVHKQEESPMSHRSIRWLTICHFSPVLALYIFFTTRDNQLDHSLHTQSQIRRSWSSSRSN